MDSHNLNINIKETFHQCHVIIKKLSTYRENSFWLSSAINKSRNLLIIQNTILIYNLMNIFNGRAWEMWSYSNRSSGLFFVMIESLLKINISNKLQNTPPFLPMRMWFIWRAGFTLRTRTSSSQELKGGHHPCPVSSRMDGFQVGLHWEKSQIHQSQLKVNKLV